MTRALKTFKPGDIVWQTPRRQLLNSVGDHSALYCALVVGTELVNSGQYTGTIEYVHFLEHELKLRKYHISYASMVYRHVE